VRVVNHYLKGAMLTTSQYAGGYSHVGLVTMRNMLVNMKNH
jgi:hypothetical protein